MPGFDWFAGMDAVNIEEIGWVLEGEDILAREIDGMATAWLERLADVLPRPARWSSPTLTVPY